MVEGWPVQFLPVASELDGEALDAAVTVEEVLTPGTAPVRMRVLTAEHLAATALGVGRPKDEIRLTQFVAEDVLDMTVLDDILRRHGLGTKWQDFCAKHDLETNSRSKPNHP